MIYELLTEGKENARTGRELAAMTGATVRQVTAQIERERREGLPICAGSGANPGYYIAENRETLQKYCEQLKHRAIELFKTRQALIRVLKQIAEADNEQGDG